MPGTLRPIVLFLGTLTSLTGLAQQGPVNQPRPASMSPSLTWQSGPRSPPPIAAVSGYKVAA